MNPIPLDTCRKHIASIPGKIKLQSQLLPSLMLSSDIWHHPHLKCKKQSMLRWWYWICPTLIGWFVIKPGDLFLQCAQHWTDHGKNVHVNRCYYSKHKLVYRLITGNIFSNVKCSLTKIILWFSSFLYASFWWKISHFQKSKSWREMKSWKAIFSNCKYEMCRFVVNLSMW